MAVLMTTTVVSEPIVTIVCWPCMLLNVTLLPSMAPIVPAVPFPGVPVGRVKVGMSLGGLGRPPSLGMPVGGEKPPPKLRVVAVTEEAARSPLASAVPATVRN